MTNEQLAFGSTLRRQRERRNLSLRAIAESTKINPALLEALERGDTSQWPSGGIYRRALIRGYATGIGLPAEEILPEFVRLFPESGAAPPRPVQIAPPSTPGDLRITLAHEGRLSARLRKVIAAGLDACLIIAAGYWGSAMASASAWTVIAIGAIAYYSMATAVLGTSPALWVLDATRSWRVGAPAPHKAARPDSHQRTEVSLEMSARP